MKSLFLSSTVLAATLILGFQPKAYSQCPGGWCPVPNAYYNQNAPSQYGYNRPNPQANPNWQGNQNPNWQGNQNPNFRNDQGWRGTTNGTSQSTYWQSNTNPNFRNDPSLRGTAYDQSTTQGTWWQSNTNPNFRNDPSLRGATYDQSTTQGIYSQTNPNYRSDQSLRGATYDQSTSQSGYFRSGDNQSFYQQNMGTQTAGSDKLLQNKIYDSLKNNYLKTNYDSVTVRVYNGNVTLSGSVESDQDREDIESRVRSVPGVRNINDQLTISATQIGYSDNTLLLDQTSTNYSSPRTSDIDLQKQVDDTLKNNYVRKNFDQVIATVSNGTVTISGTVDSDKDRQEIRERLQKIKGITNVNDRLQIAPNTRTTYNSNY